MGAALKNSPTIYGMPKFFNLVVAIDSCPQIHYTVYVDW